MWCSQVGDVSGLESVCSSAAGLLAGTAFHLLSSLWSALLGLLLDGHFKWKTRKYRILSCQDWNSLLGHLRCLCGFCSCGTEPVLLVRQLEGRQVPSSTWLALGAYVEATKFLSRYLYILYPFCWDFLGQSSENLPELLTVQSCPILVPAWAFVCSLTEPTWLSKLAKKLTCLPEQGNMSLLRNMMRLNLLFLVAPFSLFKIYRTF